MELEYGPAMLVPKRPQDRHETSVGPMRCDGLNDNGARQHVTGAHRAQEAHAVDLLARNDVVTLVDAGRCEPLEDRGRVQAAGDKTGAGPLLVTVKGEEMTYRIAPYDFTGWGGAKCDAITYHGTVTTD